MNILPADFHFLRPWCLWILPLMLVLLLFLWHRKTKAAGVDRFVDPLLLPHLLLGSAVAGKNRMYPLLLLGCGWLIGVIALAGPAWRQLPRPVYSLAAARVVILDLSPSMLAADPKPNRLDRAIFKLKDILKKSREGRTGLLVFGGEAHVVVPLTNDTATIETMLPALNVDIMPVPGDSVVEALDLAESLLERGGSAGRGDILLITDGVDDTVDALARAGSLADQGMRLSVLAVGTKEGAPVPSVGGGFEIDHTSGQPRLARVDLALLRALSEAGKGDFSPMTADDTDIDRLLSSPRNPAMDEAEEHNSGGVNRWREEGIWLLPVLLIISAISFRRGWLFALTLVYLACPQPAQAVDWDDLWLRDDQQATRILEQGDAHQAAKMFKDPAWRGAAQYKAGNFKEAAETFKARGDDYNLGNALAKAGRLQEALAAYDRALEQNPEDQDAKFNRDLAKKLLEEREKQKQEQQGQQDEQDQSDQGNQDKQNQADQGDQDQSQQDQQDQSRRDNGSDQDKKANTGEQPEPEQDRDEQKSDSGEQQDRQDQAQPPGRADTDTKKQPSEQTKAEQQAASPATPRERKPDPGQPDRASALEDPNATPTEEEMAVEQWLRQVPDDPSLLLRRKFMLEHQRRQKQR